MMPQIETFQKIRSVRPGKLTFGSQMEPYHRRLDGSGSDDFPFSNQVEFYASSHNHGSVENGPLFRQASHLPGAHFPLPPWIHGRKVNIVQGDVPSTIFPAPTWRIIPISK